MKCRGHWEECGHKARYLFNEWIPCLEHNYEYMVGKLVIFTPNLFSSPSLARGKLARGCISQFPMHLGVPIWLSSHQWDVDGSNMCNVDITWLKRNCQTGLTIFSLHTSSGLRCEHGGKSALTIQSSTHPRGWVNKMKETQVAE